MEEAFQTSTPARKSVVMVVEDEAPIRSMVSDYLRDVGFAVIEARNADEAIIVLTAGTSVDLVFTDVDMPGAMDGLMLAAWIQAFHPSVAVIVTSGVAELRGDDPGLCVLPKPYGPGLLDRKIREMLDEAARSAGAG